jgi:dienelactone hydrolase
VRERIIPEAVKLADEREFLKAFLLAREVEEVLPNDPTLTRLWGEIAIEVPLHVEPAGTDLYVRDYQDPGSPWIHLGTSPRDTIRAPDGFQRLKLEHPGYETLEWASFTGSVQRMSALEKLGALPPGMVRISFSRGRTWMDLSIYEHLRTIDVGEFFIDKYEVTNAEYKLFVDSGAYSNREYWKHEFVKDGRTLSWEAAMAQLVDETGRPGPATWAIGTYPEGTQDYPVTGVSWYEAAAYAEFAGKDLPTVYHWEAATSVARGEFLIPKSNLEGTDLAPVGSFQGSLDWMGLYDMPGNAREWCFNATGDNRFILGGAWNDPTYTFGTARDRPPFDRSAGNGFRCMKIRSPRERDSRLWQPLPRVAPRDWSKVKPFSDEVWNTWVNLFASAHLPLDSRVELTDDSPLHWRVEKVSFTTTYDQERMVAYLLLPRNAKPPFQAVVYYTGSGAEWSASSLNGRGLVHMDKCDYFVKTGRAVVYPIYFGDHERGGGGSPYERRAMGGMEGPIRKYKDLIHTLDYLESRQDIDSEKIAFLGFSRGSFPGLVASILDDRIKTVILTAAGLAESSRIPQASEFIYNSALLTTAPVLMVSGRYDTRSPYETVKVPLFNALRTPSEQKRHVVLECQHGLFPCRKEMIRECLAWLDKYLGPVERAAQ